MKIMEMGDLSKVESYLSEMDESIRHIQVQIRNLNRTAQALESVCQDDSDLQSLVRREARYLSQLRSMVDNFPMSRMVRRRLPDVEGRIQQRELEQEYEDAAVMRQASEVRESLEDLLGKFLQK